MSKLFLAVLLTASVGNSFAKDCLDYYGWGEILKGSESAKDSAKLFLKKFSEADTNTEDINHVGAGMCKYDRYLTDSSESKQDVLERIFYDGYTNGTLVGKEGSFHILFRGTFPVRSEHCDEFFEGRNTWVNSYLLDPNRNGNTGYSLGNDFYSMKRPNRPSRTIQVRYHKQSKSLMITEFHNSYSMICAFPNVEK